jgi:hypothetical protein
MLGRSDAAAILAPHWHAEVDRLFLLSQASHAFTLIHATMREASRPDPVYWFPGYFCDSGLPSLRKLTGRIAFYPVAEDFTPDWEACDRMAARQPPDVFTLAHFFGTANDVAAARAFCDRHGALLHEDCAHVLFPFADIGQLGDFVSYSPRKFLPIGDGGLVLVRGEALKAAADRAAAWLPASLHTPPRIVVPRGLRKLFRRRNEQAPLSLDSDPAPVAHFSSVWMSLSSRKHLLDAAASGGLQRIAMARQVKTAALGSAIQARYPLRHIAPAPGASPYWTAFRAADENTALQTLKALREERIGANTWPGLPPEIKAEPDRYGAAWSIRRTLVRVPVG